MDKNHNMLFINKSKNLVDGQFMWYKRIKTLKGVHLLENNSL